jgi:glycosyltransferase involved in cell wall biosynthesis
VIYLYSDILTQAGGIETYLHALATKLHAEDIPFRVAVSEQEPENAPCELLDDLEAKGIDVYRQRYVPGDRWKVRKRLLMAWLWWQLEPGDWVYCVRQPNPALYHDLVRLVHNRGAKIGASWMFAPEFYVPDQPHYDSFCQAVEETDAVISVSKCTKDQFREVYGYEGPVEVVRYHNLPLFEEPIPLPDGPPWRIGYMGRLSIDQKNLDTLLHAFERLRGKESDVRLNLYGDGPDRNELEKIADRLGIEEDVKFHGKYDHRSELRKITSDNHLFVYTSSYEGGPCFSLLELLQAGRYVVASKIGGIPDIYEGREYAGKLVEEPDIPSIYSSIWQALKRVKSQNVNQKDICNLHDDEFDIDIAHEQWCRVIFD